MHTMSVHQTQAVVPFEEFLQSIILEFLAKTTAQIRSRNIPQDEPAKEEEPEKEKQPAKGKEPAKGKQQKQS